MSARSKDIRFAYSLISPTFLVIIGLLGFPLIYAIIQSFQKVTVYEPAGTFIGIENYLEAFADPNFLGSILRSFIFVTASLSGALVIGLMIAMLLNREIPGRRILRALILLPFIVSEVSVGVIWQWMFSPQLGIINHLFRFLSLPTIRWFSDPGWAMFAIIFTNIWRLTPFAVLVLLAGLQSIDRNYYEAAYIDGGSHWQVFSMITIPMIKPMMLVTVVYLSFASFNQFATVFALTGGGPGRATEVMALYMYRTAFQHFNWGYGSALAVLLFIINVGLSMTYSKVLEKKD
ncbi:MAG: sugar ABC transporter permease [Sedimentisphaerales bacterium]|nr:sugar ABC transporter permease [Sedimentisphaerales bacterium]